MRALMFDLDGTLVTTSVDYRVSVVEETLADAGSDMTPGIRSIDRFWFGANRDELILTLFSIEPTTFWNSFAKFDRIDRRAANTFAFDDTEHLFKLREQGVRLAVVTGAPPRIAELEIAQIGKEAFELVISTHTIPGRRHKPYPDGLIHCMEKLGVGPKETAYIGNADEDIEASIAAAVLDVHIDRGEHPISIIPSRQIHSLMQIEEALLS